MHCYRRAKRRKSWLEEEGAPVSEQLISTDEKHLTLEVNAQVLEVSRVEIWV
jgi:predicted ATP-grasp superfamily ATP-dependent carboligase